MAAVGCAVVDVVLLSSPGAADARLAARIGVAVKPAAPGAPAPLVLRTEHDGHPTRHQGIDLQRPAEVEGRLAAPVDVQVVVGHRRAFLCEFVTVASMPIVPPVFVICQCPTCHLCELCWLLAGAAGKSSGPASPDGGGGGGGGSDVTPGVGCEGVDCSGVGCVEVDWVRARA